MRLRGDCCWKGLAATIAVQLAAGVLGVWAAHAMFGLPILQYSDHARTGMGQWLGEFIATFGLLLTIIGTARHRPQAVAASVALYITAGYWFTSSTSFANPAITLARSLSDSFAGIAPGDVAGFVAAQLAGALAAHWTGRKLFPEA
jgi:glycerol uptake facilitator-like aquaporin